MNRQHAEYILDAYVLMRIRESDKDASDALREVILDAMTGYKTNAPKPGITYPYATLVDTTNPPTNWDGTPKVTCSGIDPMFEQRTAVGE